MATIVKPRPVAGADFDILFDTKDSQLGSATSIEVYCKRPKGLAPVYSGEITRTGTVIKASITAAQSAGAEGEWSFQIEYIVNSKKRKAHNREPFIVYPDKKTS